MSTLNTARSLADEAHRLLRDSSPSSTDSNYDPRNHNHNSKSKTKTKLSSTRHKKSASQSQHKLSSHHHNHEPTAKKTEHLAHPSSCAQEKSILRSKIREMEKIIFKQNKKIDTLKEQLKTREIQIKRLDKDAVNGLTKDLILEDMERMMKEMQTNELVLVKQLSEQQRIAKDALSKLYESKEETSFELQNLKRNYQDMYSKKLEEERKQYEIKIEELRHENERALKEIQESQDNDKMEVSNKLGMEVIRLNSEVSQKTLENAKLKIELVDLKDTLARARRSSTAEIKGLQGSLVTMNEQSVEIRAHGERLKEKNDENVQLRIEIERLKEELLVKEKQMGDQEKRYQDKIEKIEKKVKVVHGQTKLAEEYSKEIEVLRVDLSRKEGEILEMQDYYVQKLESRKAIEETQKKEWEETAKEYQEEIQYLKAEINSLMHSRRGSTARRM